MQAALSSTPPCPAPPPGHSKSCSPSCVGPGTEEEAQYGFITSQCINWITELSFDAFRKETEMGRQLDFAMLMESLSQREIKKQLWCFHDAVTQRSDAQS